MKCQHCSYEWNYEGISITACCPTCRRYTKVADIRTHLETQAKAMHQIYKQKEPKEGEKMTTHITNCTKCNTEIKTGSHKTFTTTVSKHVQEKHPTEDQQQLTDQLLTASTKTKWTRPPYIPKIRVTKE